KAIAQYDEKGLVKTGATLADLATEIDLPADTLQTTLDTWNKAVADKTDAAFGRTSGMDHAMNTGSYHAIKVAPGVH
ncbi:flavocytochrome c, partial [Streptococcus suis]